MSRSEKHYRRPGPQNEASGSLLAEPLGASVRMQLPEMTHSHNDEIQMLAETLASTAEINAYPTGQMFHRSLVSGASVK